MIKERSNKESLHSGAVETVTDLSLALGTGSPFYSLRMLSELT